MEARAEKECREVGGRARRETEHSELEAEREAVLKRSAQLRPTSS